MIDRIAGRVCGGAVMTVRNRTRAARLVAARRAGTNIVAQVLSRRHCGLQPPDAHGSQSAPHLAAELLLRRPLLPPIILVLPLDLPAHPAALACHHVRLRLELLLIRRPARLFLRSAAELRPVFAPGKRRCELCLACRGAPRLQGRGGVGGSLSTTALLERGRR